MAFKQGDIQFLFQVSHAPAQDGLSDAEPGCRLSKPSGFRDFDKMLEITEIHRSTASERPTWSNERNSTRWQSFRPARSDGFPVLIEVEAVCLWNIPDWTPGGRGTDWYPKLDYGADP